MSIRRRMRFLCAVVGLVVVLDQLTKVAARAYLAPRPPMSVLGGIVQFAYSENVGAFLGLGAALPPLIRLLLFGVLAAVLVIGVAAYTLTARGLTRWEVAAASLVVAGGLGNLIDRVLRRGRVTDFVSVGIGLLRTGIFNVADVAIVAGVGWFLILFALEAPARRGPGQDGDEERRSE